MQPEDGEIKLQVTVKDFFARTTLTKLEDLDAKEAVSGCLCVLACYLAELPCLQMQYVGTLKIGVHNARGLAAKDMGGTCLPSVLACLPVCLPACLLACRA